MDRNYDQWLERPMLDMIDESDRFVAWAEEAGYDLEDPADLKRAQDAYEDHLGQQYEDQMIADYEAAMDRKYDEMRERSWGSGA